MPGNLLEAGHQLEHARNAIHAISGKDLAAGSRRWPKPPSPWGSRSACGGGGRTSPPRLPTAARFKRADEKACADSRFNPDMGVRCMAPQPGATIKERCRL